MKQINSTCMSEDGKYIYCHKLNTCMQLSSVSADPPYDLIMSINAYHDLMNESRCQ